MELLVEVVHGADRSTDVVLEVEPGATFGDVADSLAFLGRPGGTLAVARTGQTPRRDDRLADVDVRSGDRLTLVDAVNAAFSATPEAFGASLVVTSPSGAEVEHPLRYGDNLLGRDTDVDVVVKDQQISRRHARITVTDVVTITDLGSKNGVVINGTAITTPTLLRPGQTAEIGDLTLAIRDHVRAVEALASRNRVEFNRPPRGDPPVRRRRGRAAGAARPPAAPAHPDDQRAAARAAGHRHVLPDRPDRRHVHAPVAGPADRQRHRGPPHRPARVQGGAGRPRRRWSPSRSSTSRRSASRRSAAGSASCPAPASSAASCAACRTGCGSGRPTTPTSCSCGWARPSSRRARRSGWPAAVPATCARTSTRSPAGSRLLDDVPLPVDLLQQGGVGLAGPLSSTRALARSMVMQAITMHSPTDLAVVALVGEAGLHDWTFLKWLPHARSLGGSQLASTSHHALGLVNGLLQARSGGGGGGVTLPAVLVVIDETCPVERRRLMPLIEAGRDTGIFFLWVTSARHRLPKACGAVVEIDPDHVTARHRVHRLRPRRSRRPAGRACRSSMPPPSPATSRRSSTSPAASTTTARSPAPSPSPTCTAGTHILDDPSSILELWQQHEGGHAEHGLRVVVGMQAGAPFVLDVRQDGPHALVAGTTGAGKSEFLQSFVVGLATMHSPERVTFLLVDYKGGAAFKECVALPHTVGLVTDLDRNEVRRALISLNAELHHRELLLQKADAKDLLEMERKGHPDTPPSLLIVVDEFAALAKEVPEFVDGVVDVALRGRSLGLHLVLATQRPAGVITGQIRANTNLRIALRMAADDESADVVGSPVAAAIERRLPGRAVARIGPQELLPFQSAYVGGHTMADVQAPMVTLRLFGFDHDTAVEEERRVIVPPDHPSDLQRLVVAHRGAFGLLGAPAPRRPWLAPLAPSYELGRLPRGSDESNIVLGVSDQPGRQLQALAHFRPDADGGLLILGTGGSGKTVDVAQHRHQRRAGRRGQRAARRGPRPRLRRTRPRHPRGAAPRRLGHRRRRHRAGHPAAAHAARAHRPAGDRLRRRAGLVAARVPPQLARRRRRRAGSSCCSTATPGSRPSTSASMPGAGSTCSPASSPTVARSACTS